REAHPERVCGEFPRQTKGRMLEWALVFESRRRAPDARRVAENLQPGPAAQRAWLCHPEGGCEGRAQTNRTAPTPRGSLIISGSPNGGRSRALILQETEDSSSSRELSKTMVRRSESRGHNFRIKLLPYLFRASGSATNDHHRRPLW